MARLHNGSEFNDAFEIISVSINHNRVYRYLQNRNTYETTDISVETMPGVYMNKFPGFHRDNYGACGIKTSSQI